MPSSLIVVGLGVAWLVVLVPMVVRKRADARSSVEEEYDPMSEHEYELDDEYDDDYEDELPQRAYRPGRGGYDPETAAIVAQAKYAFRRRVVAVLLLLAAVTAVVAGFVLPVLWWAHGAVDVALVGYLTYLRRQVRIEEDVRARRQARLASRRRSARREEPVEDEDGPVRDVPAPRHEQQPVAPGAVVVDADDEDPVFLELDGPGDLRYRRAAGE
ncbi:gephyrin-like molybdotransferase receptor GlpR [Actinosynnema mirum]|uniref:Transmembrane protein n=1 Tax=Actinosynnema mirum (strain ATCC 29888 / DSM 43827 / JCM 3225 / NBRC 14064 / NCIMB 13271 / NRRL B-12336 / IMRU 3971 / 101) TaxID=446462 RepID=C6WJG2_ACTMD|nr:gephyrin-like molybdotransferase receptor GlpR [Actinosynnema mirum]ACU34594.1 hypothetical protein Amir_0631 [Actinosynnema mirum DSM 43827]